VKPQAFVEIENGMADIKKNIAQNQNTIEGELLQMN
jgi:chromosome segregation ATPase